MSDAHTRHESKTRLLDAALTAIRTKGYAATTIDDICLAAGLTKGSFFHHFKTKEELAVAALAHWSAITGALFASAPYRQHADPRDRLMGYVAFRGVLLHGALPEITCLAGTLAQEVYGTHAAIRDACEHSIGGHAAELAKDIAEAKARYAPDAAWSPESLALYTQAVLQGAFILAKARNGPEIAADCLAHLRRYLEMLLPLPEQKG